MLAFPKTTVWIGSLTLLFLVLATTTNAMTTTSAASSPNDKKVTSPPPPSLTKTETRTAKIWNRFANGYAKSPIQDQASYERKLSLTRTYFSPSTTRVLEFGCGTGGTALLHAPYVKHYHAIDVSSRMIEIAQEQQKQSSSSSSSGGDADAASSNVDFQVQGLDSLNVPDASYGVVLGLSILHLLPNRVQAIRKVHQLLKPGGTFVSSTVCIGDMGAGVVLQVLGPPLAALGVIPQLGIFTKATLRKDLQDNGFVIQEEFHPGKNKAVFLIAKKI